MKKKKVLRPVWLIVAGAVVSVGCVSQRPLLPSYSGPQPLTPTLVDRFAYPDTAISNSSTAIKRRSDFIVREVTFPLGPGGSADDEAMRLEYYDPAGSETSPVIVLLPVLNKRMLLSRYFASYFAARGYAAVVVDKNVSMNEYLRRPEQMIRRGVNEYRRVLDWVEQNPELDPDRVGLFGISLGGINAVLVSALDERVDAVVAVMAGGDLPYIFANTSDRRVVRAGSRIMRRDGASRDEFAGRLRQTIQTDPLNVAAYIDARRTLMILARSDTIVPFEKQEELRVKMGGPEAIYLPTGHRSSVIYFPLMRRSAHRFFTRQFGS